MKEEPIAGDVEGTTGIGEKYRHQYDLPEDKHQFVDVEKGELVDKANIKPIDIIKAMAKQVGQEISDPDPKCTIKGCYGRGYTSIDFKTKRPQMCKCLFRGILDRSKIDKIINGDIPPAYNRKMKRNASKNIKKRVQMAKRAGKYKNIDDEIRSKVEELKCEQNAIAEVTQNENATTADIAGVVKPPDKETIEECDKTEKVEEINV